MSYLDSKKSFWSLLLVIQMFILCLLVTKPESTKQPLINIKGESLTEQSDTISKDGTIVHNVIKL